MSNALQGNDSGPSTRSPRARFFAWARVVLCVFLLLVAVVLSPELWFRAPILSAALSRAAGHFGYQFDKGGISASARRVAWNTVRFSLELDDFSLRNSEPTAMNLDAKIKKFRVKADLKWMAFPPTLAKVDEIELDGDQIRIQKNDHPSSPKPSEPPSSPIPDLRWARLIPSFLKDFKVGRLKINIPDFQLADGSGKPLQLRGDFTRDWALNALVLWVRDLKATSTSNGVKAFLPLTGDEKIDWEKVRADVDLKIPGNGRIAGSIFNKNCVKPGQACFQGEAKWTSVKKDFFRAQVRFSLVAAKDAARLKVNAEVVKPFSGVSALKTRSPCDITLNASKGFYLDSNVKCDVLARFKLPPVPKVPQVRLPTESEVKLDLSLQIKNASDNSPYQGSLALEARPVLSPLLKASIELKSRFQGALNERLAGLHHQTDLTVDAVVPEIAKAIDLLYKTPWAVPAPFNNLRGPIQLSLKSSWKDGETEAPFELITRLDSREQSFQTRLAGVAQYSLSPFSGVAIKADWELSDVRLSAPRLDPTKIPRFFPAPEIQGASQGRKVSEEPRRRSGPAPAFHYAVHVKTPKDHPLRIDSNLVKQPVAINVDADVNDKAPLRMNLSVQPIPFEILRRKGSIESLQYSVGGGKEDGGKEEAFVDGHARVKSGDYVVRAHFFGNPDKIHVQLASDPPVPDDELWAILLFGEPPEFLDSDQKDSASATSRAVSQGAFGLMSLYIFASTPIERVNYDPVTQRVSVAFRIHEGTSLELGRSEESPAELGVKRRLGRGWSLNFQVSKAQENETRTSSAKVGAGIEWSVRY